MPICCDYNAICHDGVSEAACPLEPYWGTYYAAFDNCSTAGTACTTSVALKRSVIIAANWTRELVWPYRLLGGIAASGTTPPGWDAFGPPSSFVPNCAPETAGACCDFIGGQCLNKCPDECTDGTFYPGVLCADVTCPGRPMIRRRQYCDSLEGGSFVTPSAAAGRLGYRWNGELGSDDNCFFPPDDSWRVIESPTTQLVRFDYPNFLGTHSQWRHSDVAKCAIEGGDIACGVLDDACQALGSPILIPGAVSCGENTPPGRYNGLRKCEFAFAPNENSDTETALLRPELFRQPFRIGRSSCPSISPGGIITGTPKAQHYRIYKHPFDNPGPVIAPQSEFRANLGLYGLSVQYQATLASFQYMTFVPVEPRESFPFAEHVECPNNSCCPYPADAKFIFNTNPGGSRLGSYEIPNYNDPSVLGTKINRSYGDSFAKNVHDNEQAIVAFASNEPYPGYLPHCCYYALTTQCTDWIGDSYGCFSYVENFWKFYQGKTKPLTIMWTSDPLNRGWGISYQAWVQCWFAHNFDWWLVPLSVRLHANSRWNMFFNGGIQARAVGGADTLNPDFAAWVNTLDAKFGGTFAPAADVLGCNDVLALCATADGESPTRALTKSPRISPKGADGGSTVPGNEAGEYAAITFPVAADQNHTDPTPGSPGRCQFAYDLNCGDPEPNYYRVFLPCRHQSGTEADFGLSKWIIYNHSGSWGLHNPTPELIYLPVTRTLYTDGNLTAGGRVTEEVWTRVAVTATPPCIVPATLPPE